MRVLEIVPAARYTREALNAAFYASHENWAASIARYQTVVDTYPLYSHMDDVLIAIGARKLKNSEVHGCKRSCILLDFKPVILDYGVA